MTVFSKNRLQISCKKLNKSPLDNSHALPEYIRSEIIRICLQKWTYHEKNLN